jgi:uncharacterized protein with HEPN domain
MNKKADTKEFIFQCLKDEREKLAFFGVKNIGLFGSFVRNPTLKRAFVRSLEIIGEASKKLSEINPKHWDSRKAGSKLFMKSDLQEIP